MKNKEHVFDVINKIDPEFAKSVKEHITNTDMKNTVLGVDKTKKVRKHDWTMWLNHNFIIFNNIILKQS